MSDVTPTAEATAPTTFTRSSNIPPLTMLYVYLVDGCNLACRHCWISPRFLSAKTASKGRYLELAHVRRVIKDALPLGLGTVKLTGGEPTLHPQFHEVVREIDDAGLKTVIETNGLLVDDDLAVFFRDHNVSFVSISLDGATASTHEAMRLVEGSFASSIDGIKALANVGYNPQVICTLHQGNIGEAEVLIELAEELGCGSVKFNTLQKMGRGEKFANDNGLTIAETLDFYDHITRNVMPQRHIRVFVDIPPAFYTLGEVINNKSSCAVKNILGVLASGEYSLCGVGYAIPDLVYGHIEQDNIQDVWRNHPQIVRLREQIPLQLRGICQECVHRDTCLGKCIANNYHTTQSLNAAFTFCAQADQQGLFPPSRRITRERIS